MRTAEDFQIKANINISKKPNQNQGDKTSAQSCSLTNMDDACSGVEKFTVISKFGVFYRYPQSALYC